VVGSEAASGGARPAGEVRTGFSTDVHPFGPGDGLWLGGIRIPAAPRLHGHSDGDAALHAVAGALLGACGLGDLGSVYPADERTRRGVASGQLVRGVVGRLAEAGWRPVAVDLTILAGRPRIGEHVPAMRIAIAELLGVGTDAVSVKGSTGNLSGDAGSGRVIEAHAVATVMRAEAAP
jgi:2-C-methyl-D-erythritol 4-phosphate cytidylyltransferase / 2-C-methyl-D-erythritol 2,4-cyclodiphosphate synthase